MRSFFKVTLIWAAIGLVVATSIIFLGLYNVSLRTGHLPGISWVLHTTYRNSVLLRAPSMDEAPDLSDTDLVALGRQHFLQACSFCHAVPGEPQNETAKSMLPMPPRIEDAVKDWEPNHIYWIVQNGIKMSGMPAWPTRQRDDEIWAVVAYLAKVKSDHSAADHASHTNARLTISPSRHTGTNSISGCKTCHQPGTDIDANQQVPRLDVLHPDYVAASLRAYRAGARHSGIMQHVSSELTDENIAELAVQFAPSSRAESFTSAENLDAELLDQGEKLASGVSGDLNVPACNACHGPWKIEAQAMAPAIAGQHQQYLFNQLLLWRQGRRGGTKAAQLMHMMATELDETQMRALAAYYSSLPTD